MFRRKEKRYQEMKGEKRVSKQDIEVVAKQSNIKGLQKIKELSQGFVYNPSFYNDNVITYEEFLKDMRQLLKDEKRFKDHYCEVNHITSYDHKLSQEPGETSYINLFKTNDLEK